VSRGASSECLCQGAGVRWASGKGLGVDKAAESLMTWQLAQKGEGVQSEERQASEREWLTLPTRRCLFWGYVLLFGRSRLVELWLRLWEAAFRVKVPACRPEGFLCTCSRWPQSPVCLMRLSGVQDPCNCGDKVVTSALTRRRIIPHHSHWDRFLDSLVRDPAYSHLP
jgi:hypothetical protein